MAKERRVIRKTASLVDQAFDDQLWPIYVAAVLFGGFVCGVIVAYLRFDDPRWYANAWTALLAVPVALAACLLLLHTIDSKRKLKRASQLAIILSLLLNVMLAVWLDRDVFARTMYRISEHPSEHRQEEVVIPEYNLAQQSPNRRDQQEHLRPLQTDAADQRVDDPDREASTRETMPLENQPVHAPEPDRNPQPNVMRRQQANESPARHSDHPSLLSRQTTQTSMPRQSAVRVPESAQPTPAPATQISSADATVSRPTRLEQTQQQQLQETPSATNERNRLRVARRTDERSPQFSDSSQSVMRKAIAQPRALPRNSLAPSEDNAAARQTVTQPIRPSNTPLERQQTTGHQIARNNVDPSPTVAARIDRRERSDRLPSPTQAVVAKAADAVANRRPRATLRPDVSAVALDLDTPQPHPQPSALAAQSLPARRSSAAQQASTPSTSSQSSDASRSAQPSTPAGRRQQHPRLMRQPTQLASLPTVDPSSKQPGQPRRASRQAQAATSPVPISSPALARTTAGATNSARQPAPIAISKAATGTAGIGDSLNLDRARPADQSPALVASGFARRERATQNINEGAAMAPSDPALVKRARSGSDLPSATLRAQQVPLANAAGSMRPAQVNASAAATFSRAAARADQAEVTAARGTAEIDIGPTRVVDGGDVGRSSGGGQPDMNLTAPTETPGRSSVSGQPRVALAVNDVAEQAAAPDELGGGSPPVLTADPSAVAVVRESDGGQMSSSGDRDVVSEMLQTVSDEQRQTSDKLLGRADIEDDMSGDDATEDEQQRRLRRQSERSPTANLTARIEEADETKSDASTQTDGSDIEAMVAVTRGDSSPIASLSTSLESAHSPDQADPSERTAGGIRRAELAESLVGPVALGGGTDAPKRSATGPALAATVKVDDPVLAGRAESSGQPEAASLDTQGLRVSGRPGGLLAEPNTQLVGAIEADVVADAPDRNAPGLGMMRSASSLAKDEDEPNITALSSSGAPFQRRRGVVLPDGSPTADQVEAPTVSATAGRPAPGDLTADMVIGPMSRVADESIMVDINADLGPGGLDARPGLKPGIKVKSAREDSPEVQVRNFRFQKRSTGGLPNTSMAVVISAEPYSRRAIKRDEDTSGGQSGPYGPQTEEAIERGLVFLAKHQQADGSWTLKGFGEETTIHSDTAATGLALLAFQGAGYNHREHKYADVLLQGIGSLVENQQRDGNLFIPMDLESNKYAMLYSHSIATLALCEAYGMTQDPALKQPAQRALDYIVRTQHQQRGGWRYTPNYSSDTSVTGWMMMALKSGDLASLTVPQKAYEGIETWLDLAQASPQERHLYKYNPYAPNSPQQAHGRRASKTMTSVGLLMRLYTGWKRDNPDMIKGADYLKRSPPVLGTANKPQRDTYYWYYATQVMFHMGGEYWQYWNSWLHPMLVNTQIKRGALAGSWDPRKPVPDRWAAQAGRLYVTTMNLLSLEVYYRHLPLFEDTAR